MANIGEKLSEAEVGEMVREMDADGDGNISYDEFVMWINADLSAAATSKGDGDAEAKTIRKVTCRVGGMEIRSSGGLHLGL